MNTTKPFAILQAGCKINLGLRITGRREDGYHTLDSIFWPLSVPYDTLEFYWSQRAGIGVHCATQGIDLTNNTLTKAHEAFLQGGGIMPEVGVEVHLHKSIPHGAGLGGGSSDAASLLLCYNKYAKKPLSPTDLHTAALKVGADVPFFLHNVPAHVQGIGEIITKLDEASCARYEKKFVVLLCPDINISTPWAYAAYDKMEQEENFAKSCKKKLTKNGVSDKYIFACAGNHDNMLNNDFEQAVFAKHPRLAELKQGLLDKGAEYAFMSGSGSTLVGIVNSPNEAKSLAKCFQNAQCKVFTATL